MAELLQLPTPSESVSTILEIFWPHFVHHLIKQKAHA